MKNKKLVISILVIIVAIILGIIFFIPKNPSSDSFTITRNFYINDYSVILFSKKSYILE